MNNQSIPMQQKMGSGQFKQHQGHNGDTAIRERPQSSKIVKKKSSGGSNGGSMMVPQQNITYA